MKIKAIKTKIISLGEDLTTVIAEHIPHLEEKSVLAITSKVISYQQRRWVAKDESNPNQKFDLVRQEADWYIDPHSSKYNLMMTTKNHSLAVWAGIDESNAAGGYILWPINLQETINHIWEFLRSHYGVKEVGIIVTDSRTVPFRWGVTGTYLAHTGFEAVHDYVGEKDLFGRPIMMEKTNIAESMAAAVTLEMGEVAESQPFGIITEIPLIKFQDRVPTEAELKAHQVEIEDDMYGPFFMAVPWKKGGGGK